MRGTGSPRDVPEEAGLRAPRPLPARPSIFPAIDLRKGRCVRLIRGARGAEIDYGGDPLAAARRWVGEGAEWLHAIDLGGAFGEPDSLDAILEIARSVPVPVQAGGGLRGDETVDRLLDGGVQRVILGTRAFLEPGFLERMVARRGPSRIVLALDVAGGRVKVKGWEAESGLDLEGGIAFARKAGAEHVLVTAIERDGTLEGPSLPLLRRALEGGAPGVVAAGGIGTIDHIRGVLDLRHPSLEGVVVGRALYEGTVKLPGALELCQEYRR